MPLRAKTPKRFECFLIPVSSYLIAVWSLNVVNPPIVIAAGGLTRVSRPKPLIGPAVMLHVIEPYRRQGIGQTLLKQLAALAARHVRGGTLCRAKSSV